MRPLNKLEIWIFVGIVVAIGVSLAILIPIGEQAIPVALVALTVLAWAVNRRYFNAPYVSPTVIVGGFFLLIAVFGYILRDALANLGGRGTSLFVVLTEAQSFKTFCLITSAAFITFIVSGVALRTRPKGADDLAGFYKFEWVASEPKAGMVALTVVPLIVMTIELGPSLIERNSYLFSDRGSFTGTIGTALATGMIVVLGYIFGASSGPKKLSAAILLAGYSAMLFSMASRRLALIPILLALGVFIARNSRRTRLGMGLSAVATAILMPLPLMFRSSTLHGLIPYWERLSQFSLADVEWLATLNNVLVSFGIIGSTAYGDARLQASDLWISLNPISGDSAGWYEIAPRLRLNFYTPMAGLGELANVGWLAFVAFCVAMGLLLAWVEVAVRRHLLSGSRIFAAMVLGLTAFFALQMVQYNLRSAVRMLVYLVVLELGRRLVLYLHQQVGVKDVRKPVGRRPPHRPLRGTPSVRGDTPAH